MEDEDLDQTMFIEEVEALEKKIEQWDNYEDLIVMYGSSSLRLWENVAEDLAPLNVLNLGFGGSSFALCVYYYHRLFKKIKKAAHIVFYCGDNDLENGASPEQVMRKFRKLVTLTRLDFPYTSISVITIKPSPIRTHLQPKIKLTNSLIRKDLIGITRAYQINIFDSMLDEKNEARPELYMEDQLHLNERGYRIWRGIVRKHFGI